MKIGIVTLSNHFNYGNRLQNFALQNTLQKLGADVVTLWTEDNIFVADPFLKINFKSFIKYVFNWKGFREHHCLRNDNIVYDTVRKLRIKKFSDNHINIDYNVDFENLSLAYDFFIVGSDQVWNKSNIKSKRKYLRIFSLLFAEPKQRISYAASFGVSNLPKAVASVFKNAIVDFEKMSVREETGAEIVKEITGRNVPVLVDPTLLLSKEEWQSIGMKPKWYNSEKYILAYCLGDVPKILKQIADIYGYKIYNLMNLENLNLYTSSVEEFLWLTEHAQLVFTDSFHACVFSIIFNRPFLVVNRREVGMPDMTSRIDTLMKLFGYQDRFIDFNCTDVDYNKIMTIDFSRVVEIQDRERKRSLKFLKDAMNLE